MRVKFDTLQYAKGAEAVGIPRAQAEYLANEMAKLIDESLATKNDLLKLKNDLIIKLGGMMIVCSSIIIGILGFIVKG